MPHPLLPARQLAAVVAAGLLLSACGGGDAGTAAAAPPPATRACAAVEFPPLQFGSHLLGDNEPPVPFSSTPPTSGWHTSGAVPQGVVTDPLSEPAQVSVLEAGGVVVTYADLPEDDVQTLIRATEGRHAGIVVVTPYDGLADGEVAFTSWGAVQRCDGLDEAALDAYVAAYGSEITPHG